MEKITVVVGSDHAGFEMKEKICAYLEGKGISVQDMGCNSTESCDYPDFAWRWEKRFARVPARKAF
nr:RpiB/LacA/LacB family sugar-phosphate isomerase [Desulforamulus aquiferis]